jgi:hypothetical protein
MNLRSYFQTTKVPARKDFAAALGINVDYLYLCSLGKRQPSPDLCKRIVAHDPRFSLAELRPDIWNGWVDSLASSDDTQPPVGDKPTKTKNSRKGE